MDAYKRGAFVAFGFDRDRAKKQRVAKGAFVCLCICAASNNFLSRAADADAEHKWAYAQEQCKRFDPFKAAATLPEQVEEVMPLCF